MTLVKMGKNKRAKGNKFYSNIQKKQHLQWYLTFQKSSKFQNIQYWNNLLSKFYLAWVICMYNEVVLTVNSPITQPRIAIFVNI